MTDDQHKQLQSYVQSVAEVYCLKDWVFSISQDEPDSEDVFASICCTYGKKHATIWVGSMFFDASPEVQRQGVVHELTHCHISMQDNWIRTLFEAGEILKASYNAYRLNMELGVDGIADAVAPFMPLPSFDVTLDRVA